MSFITLDIETSPKEEYKHDTEAALNRHRNVIDLVAYTDGISTSVNRGVVGISDVVLGKPICGHNLKFDLINLIHHGVSVEVAQYEHDTQFMGVALSHKIPERWLDEYEEKRRQKNKETGRPIHRKAGRYSLKTMAPYFLGVDPFWETETHNDAEYAAKDVKYTHQLANYLLSELRATGTYEFYYEKLMPWARMLLKAELAGIGIDLALTAKREVEAEAKYKESQAKLDELWAPAYFKYSHLKKQEVAEQYALMAETAKAKIKDPTDEKIKKVIRRYGALGDKALAKVSDKMNLASPTQLKWILKDFFKLDIETFDGDEESTGKAVLQRLAAEGRDDIRTFLDYRKYYKLAHAFYPSYRDKAVNGRLYPSYNLSGTRTGRLSSSGVINFQQVPRDSHDLFVAAQGNTLIYRDASAIEPRLLAFLSECPELCSIFITGSDFHSENVRTFLGLRENDTAIKSGFGKERDLAKEVGLSILYGAWKTRVHESSTKRGFGWTEAKCEDIVQNMHIKYEQVFKFKEEVDSAYKEHGYYFNIFGRPCVLEDNEKWTIKMTGLNTLVQSSASDLVLETVCRTINRCEKELGIEVLPVGLIHDAGLLECKKEHVEAVDKIYLEEFLRWDLQTKWGRIPILSEGKIGPRWA